jgi:transcriptional regulator with XRE-family HTH domain
MTSEVMAAGNQARIIHAMNASTSALPPRAHGSQVGLLLREWRSARHLSQLGLALDVGVSARHLSCIETGKAQPSRDMIVRLADALDVPLRERNALLLAAGYAPTYSETPLATDELAPMRQAIEFILRQQEPYPALVMNRYWDVVMVNDALTRVFHLVRGGPPLHGNVLRQIFDPDDMRGHISNWEEVAREVIGHMQDQVAAAPSDAKARALLDEVLRYPDVPPRWGLREPARYPTPLLTTVFHNREITLRFFSTFTTFGTPWDITIEELRIESMFPADEETADLCRSLRAGQAG